MRLAVLLLLFFAAPAVADDPLPRVKVELLPKSGAWVGQRVTLAVTLYTPDLFAGVPSFDMPPIPGAVVIPPSGSIVGSETIGNTSFTTQRHEFAIYTQRAGEVRIPAFTVRFESNAGFGKPTIKRQVTTESVSFTTKTPPGAEGLGTVIAARNLKVKDEWQPEPQSPKVGDAFTRTITVTADDVPGMVFPSFRLDGISGLAAYPKEPVVNDHTERGALIGQRSETITYVCEASGMVTVPERTLTWYDLDANEVKTAKLPGRTFTIATAPKPKPDTATAAITPNARFHWRAAVAVGLLLTLCSLLIALVWSWCEQAYAKWRESESAYFARFCRTCRSNNPHMVFIALSQWLDHFGPILVDEFASRADDPELRAALVTLQDAVFGMPRPNPLTWSEAGFVNRVRIARKRLLQSASGTSRRAPVLPPLNPT